MAGDPAPRKDEPPVEAILDALGDPDCREILRTTDEPMTANELTDACAIPQSTLYRKLDLLSRASLIRELVEIGPEGGRTSHYERDLTDVTLSITDHGDFSITIDRPTRAADERLAFMWSKMGDEL